MQKQGPVRNMMQVKTSEKTPLLTVLLEGPPGAGKTAIAATCAIESQFPFVKVVSAENMVGYSEQAKASQIAKVFDDAYKVTLLHITTSDCSSCVHCASGQCKRHLQSTHWDLRWSCGVLPPSWDAKTDSPSRNTFAW